MIELKPCPFCGEQPESEYKGGTQYEIECCYAYVSVQICDHMTTEERLAEPDLTAENGFCHQDKYVKRAKIFAAEYWNYRASENPWHYISSEGLPEDDLTLYDIAYTTHIGVRRVDKGRASRDLLRYTIKSGKGKNIYAWRIHIPDEPPPLENES